MRRGPWRGFGGRSTPPLTLPVTKGKNVDGGGLQGGTLCCKRKLDEELLETEKFLSTILDWKVTCLES